MSFSRIFVANRGEIACRIQRTAQAMGYSTAVGFTDADADAPFVKMADVAIRIGDGPASTSYLDIEKIIGAANTAGAGAIHPGYGFLSENADFAQAVKAAGLVFIGPSVEAIRLMGSKRLAKLKMIEAGVPCIPGYSGAEQDDPTLIEQAAKIGYPVMIKASAGGGGRGLRLVHEPDQLVPQLALARAEALAGFGHDELILEKAVIEPRHIEIQIFADQHGQVFALGERDCSVQRRHQKVIEEAPSPAVNPELRNKIAQAAVAAVRNISYLGAGTVEFLLAQDGQFYFMEMNTRLQVEHPVTEMISGLDLVEWQIRVAAGEKLPAEWSDLPFQGHALEVRLCAEDAFAGFVPQTGKILKFITPPVAGVRIDSGVESGSVISSFYDSMVAKIIAYGPNRKDALRKLNRTLENTIVHGLTTNLDYLKALINHPAFASGQTTTSFIPQYFSKTDEVPVHIDESTWLLAATLFLTQIGQKFWQSSGGRAIPIRLQAAGDDRTLLVLPVGEAFHFQDLRISLLTPHRVRINDVVTCFDASFDQSDLWLTHAGKTLLFSRASLSRSKKAQQQTGAIIAPMAGKIVALKAEVGAAVAAGEVLIVLEAMKMQHELKAKISGRLSQLNVKLGDQANNKQTLALIEE